MLDNLNKFNPKSQSKQYWPNYNDSNPALAAA